MHLIKNETTKGKRMGSFNVACSISGVSIGAGDALAFIKRWSRFKKAHLYFNYFEDRRGDLNLKTGRYKWTER
jgi:hypothetical protein